MKAWVIRWEWIGDHAAHPNPFIVARRAEDVRLTDLDILQWTENGRQRSLKLHSAMPGSGTISSSESG